MGYILLQCTLTPKSAQEKEVHNTWGIYCYTLTPKSAQEKEVLLHAITMNVEDGDLCALYASPVLSW